MQRSLRKLARVYRAAQDGCPAAASAMLTITETNDLKAAHEAHLKSAESGESFSGKLMSLDGQVQGALGMVEALIEVADPQRGLAVGTFVNAEFLAGAPKPALVVPQSAVLLAADGTYIYAVNGEHFSRAKVKPGATAEGLVEIEDGLYPGDKVVTRGVENLWLIELSVLKGGKPCCAPPKKETAR
jgi:multidrug efflux pump subunit AcrA (membrane-fusion protein)